MTMQDIGTISFTDLGGSGEGVIVIRASSTRIGLAISLESDGDIEILLKPEDVTQLLVALQRAIDASVRS